MDDPNFQPQLHPIEAHSQLAPLYAYRAPYLKMFFQKAVSKIGLDKSSKVLDLCCGRGELSSGFAPFVDSVIGLDGSQGMLDRSISLPNIRYQLNDINKDDLSGIGKFDCITIGSAIHWLNKDAISKIIEHNLISGGKILISHPAFFFKPGLRSAIDQVNTKYKKNLDVSVPLSGKEKLEGLGFLAKDKVFQERIARIRPEFLFRNQLSLAYDDFFISTSENREEYKNSFFEAIHQHIEQEFVPTKVINWGLIYSK